MNINSIRAVICRIKLMWWKNFRQDLVSKSLKLRKGSCKMCGGCCGNCAFLLPPDKEGKRFCATYENRPSFCPKDTPIHPIQRNSYCGFYWTEEDLKSIGWKKCNR